MNTLLTQGGANVLKDARRLSLNVPFLAVTGIAAFAGQLFELGSFHRLPALHSALFLATMLAQTALLLGLVAVALGLTNELGGSRLRAPFSGLAFLAAQSFLWDSYGYRALGLHLDESLPVIVRAVMVFDSKITSRKLTAFVAGVTLCLATLLAGALLEAFVARRFHLGRRRVRIRPVLMTVLGSAALLAGLQLITRFALLEKGRRDYVDRVWQLDLALPSKQAILVIEHPQLAQPPTPAEIESRLSTIAPSNARPRPNIFIFVVESLRRDHVTEALSPRLARLQRQSIPLARASSGGNCTHVSWCTIFSGLQPLSWSLVAHERFKPGTIPFRALARLGYRTTVLATPSLAYFGAKTAFFGDDLKLAEDIHDYGALGPAVAGLNTAECDRVVMDRVSTQLASLGPDSARLFLVFLDSPHHDYSWPSDWRPPFTKFAETVTLYPGDHDPQWIELVHNRYRNSVAFVDTLMGAFLDDLAARGLDQSSLIVFTGDHGEEFMERGHFTHSSELDRFQTSVPLMVCVPPALGRPPSQAPLAVASHVDIFPTIFDALGVADEVCPLLQGHSLIGRSPPTYAMSAQCSSWTPPEIVLDDGSAKAVVELDGQSSLWGHLTARRLRVIDLLDPSDESLLKGLTGPAAERLVNERFGRILSEVAGGLH